jgi:hypothetical protein
MQDADAIAQGLLIPMSLPWMHKIIPVARNIPCDIDDLTEIIVADDGSYTPFENGPLGFGRFDGGQLRRGNPTLRLTNSLDAVCSASRRSDAVGVIEMSTVAMPPHPADESNTGQVGGSDGLGSSTKNQDPIKHQATSPLSSSLPEGEISLRLFEEVESKRIQRITQASSCARKKFISVRVNSSSSRSSILPSIVDLSKSPFLEARLPAEVQNGKYTSLSKARKIAEELGTFNARDGAGKYDASNSSRTPVGRCQLMWSQKSRTDQPHRGVFFSRLTGSRLESGCQKRPTEIRVCLKVDGEIVKPDGKGSGSENDCPIDSITRSSETVGYGVDTSFSTYMGSNFATKQCTLNSDKLIEKVMKRSEEADPQTNGSKTANASTSSSVGTANSYPPRFECVPCLDGQVCTVCTSPGSIHEKSVHELLNNAAKLYTVSCTICWSSSTGIGSEVRECFQCGLLVHPSCCLDQGKLESYPANSHASDRWKCAVCNAEPHESDSKSEPIVKHRRKSRPPAWLQDANVESSALKRQDEPGSLADVVDVPTCALCPFVGGAMSPCESSGAWIHEVCRLWAQTPLLTEHNLGSNKSPGTEICALCGASESIASDDGISHLIKCAGSRCGVYFHPMCALVSQRGSLVSRVSMEGLSSIEKAKSIDRDICARFILSGLRCEYLTGGSGKNPGTRLSQMLRVGFCGLHNPRRTKTFQGLYPGGPHTENGVVTVPSLSKA